MTSTRFANRGLFRLMGRHRDGGPENDRTQIGGVAAGGLLVVLALFAVSCNADTIGPTPNGATESSVAVVDPGRTDVGGALPGESDELAFVDTDDVDTDDVDTDGGETAADESVADEPEDAVRRPASPPLGPPGRSAGFIGDGKTLVANDGALLVTCGRVGVDIESDGRIITSIAVSSEGEISTFQGLGDTEISIAGSIQTVWVAIDGIERRFDC